MTGRDPEARPGSAGARPSVGGLGAMSGPPERTASIEVHDLVVRYGAVAAVRGVTFTVGAGEHVTLLGPSGCGKTTTLRAVAGLEHPASGEIRIGSDVVYSGRARVNVPPERRGLSMVFQSYAIWPHMTVFDNVAYGLRVRRRPEAEVKTRVVRGEITSAGPDRGVLR